MGGKVIDETAYLAFNTRATNRDSIQVKPYITNKHLRIRELKRKRGISKTSEDWPNGSSLIQTALLGPVLLKVVQTSNWCQTLSSTP